MALENAISVKEKRANAGDQGVKSSIINIFMIWAGMVPLEPKFGKETDTTIPPDPTPGSVEELIQIRNTEVDTHFANRLEIAQKVSTNDYTFGSLIANLTNSIPALKELTTRTFFTVTKKTTEGDLMRIFSDPVMMDLLICYSIASHKPLQKTLTPTSLTTFYNQFWDGAAIDPTDPDTWGNFVYPTEYVDDYWDESYYSQFISKDTTLEENNPQYTPPA